MVSLVSDIINETVELPETILEHGYGTYTVTKTLTIVQNNEEWEYVVRYNGSPLSFENEQITQKGMPAHGVRVTFTRLQSCYVSWEDSSVSRGLLWDIFLETDYEDLEFVAEDVSIKVF